MSKRKVSRSNVEKMFNNIAPKYDFLNHLLSAGIDIRWRRKASKIVLNLERHDEIADFATGTGDLAIDLARKVKPKSIVGLDFSEQMLAVAREKIARQGLAETITLQQENCENTSLQTESVDVVTCGFGIRNFNSPENGLKEMLRVLRPGGTAVLLELCTPKKGLLSSFVRWYYFKVMPFVGKHLAGNKGAYFYLPASIYDFPGGEDFCEMMREVGFKELSFKSLTFNMVNLYTGKKPKQ